MSATVTFDNLELALCWVSAGAPSENSAFISKETGKIFYSSMNYDTDEEVPGDVDDPSLYWSVPHKNDLDLGRNLVFRFVDEHLPSERDRVYDFFHRRGAYARFKDLLEHQGRLDQWYEFELTATEQALREWAQENGLCVVPPPAATRVWNKGVDEK